MWKSLQKLRCYHNKYYLFFKTFFSCFIRKVQSQPIVMFFFPSPICNVVVVTNVVVSSLHCTSPCLLLFHWTTQQVITTFKKVLDTHDTLQVTLNSQVANLLKYHAQHSTSMAQCAKNMLLSITFNKLYQLHKNLVYILFIVLWVTFQD